MNTYVHNMLHMYICMYASYIHICMYLSAQTHNIVYVDMCGHIVYMYLSLSPSIRISLYTHIYIYTHTYAERQSQSFEYIWKPGSASPCLESARSPSVCAPAMRSVAILGSMVLRKVEYIGPTNSRCYVRYV